MSLCRPTHGVISMEVPDSQCGRQHRRLRHTHCSSERWRLRRGAIAIDQLYHRFIIKILVGLYTCIVIIASEYGMVMFQSHLSVCLYVCLSVIHKWETKPLSSAKCKLAWPEEKVRILLILASVWDRNWIICLIYFTLWFTLFGLPARPPPQRSAGFSGRGPWRSQSGYT